TAILLAGAALGVLEHLEADLAPEEPSADGVRGVEQFQHAVVRRPQHGPRVLAGQRLAGDRLVGPSAERAIRIVAIVHRRHSLMRHSSMTSAARVAAFRFPVWPTMSGFAKFSTIRWYWRVSMRRTASSATSRADICGLRS